MHRIDCITCTKRKICAWFQKGIMKWISFVIYIFLKHAFFTSIFSKIHETYNVIYVVIYFLLFYFQSFFVFITTFIKPFIPQNLLLIPFSDVLLVLTIVVGFGCYDFYDRLEGDCYISVYFQLSV